MRKLCFLLLLLLLVSVLTLTASASSATTVIDNAGLATDTEFLRNVSACNCTFANFSPYLVTGTEASAPDNSTVRRICGLDEDSDAIVLYIRFYKGTYYYDMYTFGKAYDAFTDREIDTVLDDPDVYTNLKAGRIEEGYQAFYHACHPIVADYYGEYLKQIEAERERQQRAPLTAVLVGLISGVVVAGITVLCVFLYYRKKRHGESYPLDRYARLNLTQANDIFIGSHVTRVRVHSSSSGGRSGGGGGGGHRGGR